MMPLEGRVLPNLDEFMLRLGHLTVASTVSAEIGPNLYRITEELAERLTCPYEIPADMIPSVSAYLFKKNLCQSSADETAGTGRYPELRLDAASSQPMLVIEPGQKASIWWQDYMLAQPAVASRVGAITARAKSGSKSGLSHILDWGILLDLLASSGDLTTEGRLLNNVWETGPSVNPYVMGSERIIFAWSLFQADLDVIARLCRRIETAGGVLRRREAAAIFVQTIVELEEAAGTARNVSARQVDAVYASYRDLTRAADKAGKQLDATSTAWHRASSRFESLVDLGLLAKPSSVADSSYSYHYEGTELLAQFTKTIEQENEWDAWFDKHFNSLFLKGTAIADASFVAENIAQAAALVGSGSSLFPINSLLLALTVVADRSGVHCSLEALREGLLEYTRANPDVARLSAGRYGKGAEFVSLRLKRT